ncbi:MAG: hypothetical protein QF578_20645, partial [Alphaproteobacteria bacterium]|nr:hypothetical protein [Alphaproteobacteria bacterium]
ATLLGGWGRGSGWPGESNQPRHALAADGASRGLENPTLALLPPPRISIGVARHTSKGKAECSRRAKVEILMTLQSHGNSLSITFGRLELVGVGYFGVAALVLLIAFLMFAGVTPPQ